MRTHRERGEKGAYTYAMAPMVRNASRAEPDASEIGKFSALAPRWWDPSGPMAPLHAINAARVHYVRDRLCAHVGRPVEGRTPLRGLRILDIGCGAGLLAEPLARLGATVTGVMSSTTNSSSFAEDSHGRNGSRQ